MSNNSGFLLGGGSTSQTASRRGSIFSTTYQGHRVTLVSHAYDTITSFLEDCKLTDVITKCRYDELMTAVNEAVSGMAKPALLIEREDEAAASVLSVFAKSDNLNQTPRNRRSQSSLMADFAFLSSDQEGPPLGSILIIQRFFRRVRKKVSEMQVQDQIQLKLDNFLMSVRPQESELQHILSDLSGNSHNVSLDTMEACVLYGIVKSFNLVENLSIDVDKLKCFVSRVRARYLDQHYHNFSHAFDVFQMCHLTITNGGVRFLKSLDILVLLLAGFSHDVAHPGKSNNYLISVQDPLAVRYNDMSVLENFHASLFFQILYQEECNFLRRLSTRKRTLFRKEIIGSILATDPAIHYELGSKIESRFSHLRDDSINDPMHCCASDRSLIIQGLVHLCDIGNCFRKEGSYLQQVTRLEREYFAQGDELRRLGIPSLALQNREKDSLAVVQSFWISSFVLPLAKLFSFIYPTLFPEMVSNAESNEKTFAQLVDLLGPKTAEELLLFYRYEENHKDSIS